MVFSLKRKAFHCLFQGNERLHNSKPDTPSPFRNGRHAGFPAHPIGLLAMTIRLSTGHPDSEKYCIIIFSKSILQKIWKSFRLSIQVTGKLITVYLIVDYVWSEPGWDLL